MARSRGSFVSSFAGVELSPGLEEMLSETGIRTYLRHAGTVAGNNWLIKYLPLRWEPLYARQVLGAQPGRDGVPFFSQGRMILQAAQSRVRTRERARAVELRISIPAGGLAFHPQLRRAFTRLPSNEMADIMAWHAAALKSSVAEAMARKPMKSSLRRGKSARLSMRGAAAVVRATKTKGAVSNLALGQRLAGRRARLLTERERARVAAFRDDGSVDAAAQRLPVSRMSRDGRRLAVHRWKFRFGIVSRAS
jgi:hypothetical protein